MQINTAWISLVFVLDLTRLDLLDHVNKKTNQTDTLIFLHVKMSSKNNFFITAINI